MGRSRIAVVVSSTLLLLFAAGGIGGSIVAAPQATRIGAFPPRMVGAAAEQLAGRGYERWLGDELAAADTRGVEIVALTWPGDPGCPTCPVSFGDLLKIARAADVHGFVLATVTVLEAGEENTGPSATGRIGGRFGLGRGRDRRKATVRIALEGGLVDPGSGEVAAPLSALTEAEDDDYDGPDMNEVLTAGRSHHRFGDTPIAAAGEEAAGTLTAAAAAAAASLSRTGRPQPRPGAPAGLAFTRAIYEQAVEPADNQWLSIEVFNGADEPRSFALVADAPDGIVAGFMGRGSEDYPARLDPGTWKQVRMVITAGGASSPTYEIPIHLIDLGATGGPAAESPSPHDEAIVRLALLRDEMRLRIEPIADSEVTLARRYRISNAGSQALTDLTVIPEGEAAETLFVHPAVQHATLEAGASLEITVGPRLQPGFRSTAGTVSIRSAAGRQPLTVTFTVPEGKQVWLAEGDSRRSWLAELGFCTNRGAEESEIGGPAMGIFECAMLGMRIASYEKTQGLYRDAPQQNGYGDWSSDQLQDWVLEQSGGEVAGTTDGETGETDCRREAFDGAGDRIGQWEYEACLAHEGLHATEHVAQGDALADRANANNWSPSEYEEALRDLTRDGELEAYDVTLEALRQRYAENCSAWGGGSFATLPVPDRPRRLARSATRATFNTTIRAPHGPALAGPVLLEANFELAYGRDTYTPHDTRIFFNGQQAGEMLAAVPEGRYLYPIDPSWLDVGGNNRVRIEVENMNWSHYLVASRVGLSAPVTAADRMVIASSQAEADRLYGESTTINHGQPDLTVAMSPGAALPAAPADGEQVTIPVRIVNTGEVPSPAGLLRVHNEDIGEGGASSNGLAAEVLAHVTDATRVNELVEPIAIPPLGPFESAEIPVLITYDRGRISRLVFNAEIAGEFDAANNAMPYTFVSPDLSSPLLGVDYPDLTQAPILSTVLELPATPEIQAQSALQLEGFLGRLDYMDDLSETVNSLLRRFDPRGEQR